MDYTLEPKDDQDQAYGEGYRAREVENLSILDNPYPDTSRLAAAWADGYYDAQAELEGHTENGT